MTNNNVRLGTFRRDATEMTPLPNVQLSVDQVFIEDLTLEASIGVYQHELTQKQPVQINIIMDLSPLERGVNYSISNIVCYDQTRQGVKAILDDGHIGLVEDLAEKIACYCLEHQRVLRVDIRVSKPRAIKQTTHVGVRIVRVK